MNAPPNHMLQTIKQFWQSSVRPWTLAMIGLLVLTGCCDNEIFLYGSVVDATDGTALDSVQVTIFQSSKRQLSLFYTQVTDSTGGYEYWDFGCFRDADYFLGTFTRPGYRSQSVDFAVGWEEAQVQLERE